MYIYIYMKPLTLSQKQLSSGGDQSVEINTELSRLTSDLAEIGQQKIRTTTEVRRGEGKILLNPSNQDPK